MKKGWRTWRPFVPSRDRPRPSVREIFLMRALNPEKSDGLLFINDGNPRFVRDGINLLSKESDLFLTFSELRAILGAAVFSRIRCQPSSIDSDTFWQRTPKSETWKNGSSWRLK